MLWFGASVMDDGFVYNIHHLSLTHPRCILCEKGNLACQVLFPLMEHGVSLNGTKVFP